MLKNLKIRKASYVEDSPGQYVYHVQDPHELIQAAGYVKYKHGVDTCQHILFRGQSKLYESLPPTLFREISTHSGQLNKVEQLKNAILAANMKNNIFKTMASIVHEPILQHYGFKTSWIDVVDNIWIALWFACHKAYSTGPINEYLHFEKRTDGKEPTGFAYILFVSVDSVPIMDSPYGTVVGRKTELVDLRVAAPSIFLRPHAQHGLLVRMRGNTDRRPIDYSPQIKGIVRIKLSDALEWLGNGKMLGVHALFPPPFYDRGYDILLDSGIGGSKEIGSIHHIGA
jgi:hypothetical protein